MHQLRSVCALLAIAVGFSARPCTAQSADNVLVVANSGSLASIEIADYYASTRHIPSDQILRLPLAATVEVSRSVYESTIEQPVAAWLTGHTAQDRILYIVLTKGVPLRVAGSTGESMSSTCAAIGGATISAISMARRAPRGMATPERSNPRM